MVASPFAGARSAAPPPISGQQNNGSFTTLETGGTTDRENEAIEHWGMCDEKSRWMVHPRGGLYAKDAMGMSLEKTDVQTAVMVSVGTVAHE